MTEILPRNFYCQATLTVAKDLLGKVLVRETDNQETRQGVIVETEAYRGPADLAAHSSSGITKRTQAMFGPAGHAYVYLIYGIHHCFNVVSKKPGEAVLIRALEPIGDWPQQVAAGPGKLTRWLDITRDFYGWDLTRGERLWIADANNPQSKIIRAKRIGVDYAGEWAEKLWRFYLANSPSVSQK